MKRKVFTYLLCVVVALCCCSCKFEPEADSEQPQVITKEDYFERFKTIWGFDISDKKEEYGFLNTSIDDLRAYYVFKVSKNEINIEFETIDIELWNSQIDYINKLFIDTPQEYRVDFSHNLSFLYQENYYTPKRIDKLYLIYDDTVQTLTVIDLRT